MNGNLALSRALGDFGFKKNRSIEAEAQAVTANPDLKTVALTAEDEFIILACDGIWDVMTNQQAVDFVRAKLAARPAMTLEMIAEKLCDECMSKDGSEPGCDNETAMIVVLRPQGKAAREAGGAEAAAAAEGPATKKLKSAPAGE